MSWPTMSRTTTGRAPIRGWGSRHRSPSPGAPGAGRSDGGMRSADSSTSTTARRPSPAVLLGDRVFTPQTHFDRVAAASGIRTLRAPFRAPRANATCERFLGSVRRECLDHVLVLGERHLRRLLREDVTYFNAARPHQGVQQRVPVPSAGPMTGTGRIDATPVLGGLHHSYCRAA